MKNKLKERRTIQSLIESVLECGGPVIEELHIKEKLFCRLECSYCAESVTLPFEEKEKLSDKIIYELTHEHNCPWDIARSLSGKIYEENEWFEFSATDKPPINTQVLCISEEGKMSIEEYNGQNHFCPSTGDGPVQLWRPCPEVIRTKDKK